MIVYLEKKTQFLEDVDSNKIEERIHAGFQRTYRRSVGRSELSAWKTDVDWVELPDAFTPRKDLFVTRVVGESMNRRIPNGSWCLFKRTSAGSRSGKAVLVELFDRQDPESGGRYTVKIYQSEKKAADDSWEHSRIVLKPDSTNANFSDIVLEPSETETLRAIGELVAVL